jgi:hypothetical protein
LLEGCGLSGTRKDEHFKKTAVTTLQVVKNADGTYEVFWRGELVCSRVQERWLSKELCVRDGFCGEEYDAILRHLNESGDPR